jgi:hypothetical protein
MHQHLIQHTGKDGGANTNQPYRIVKRDTRDSNKPEYAGKVRQNVLPVWGDHTLILYTLTGAITEPKAHHHLARIY